MRVAHTLKPDDDAPSVQSHYKTFNPITGVSAPVPRIDTLTLMAAGHLGFSLGIGTTGSCVPLSEMEEGPPKTVCRGSLQTTTSCEGKELSW